MGENSRKRVKIPSIIDGKWLVFARSEPTASGVKVVATCTLCVPPKEICGSDTSSGNFSIHLKRAHPKELEEHASKRTKPPQGQPGLDHLVTGVTNGVENAANQLVTNYVVNAMRPLSTVECPHFQAMVKGLIKIACKQAVPDIALVTRYGLDSTIKSSYQQLVKDIQTSFKDVRYLCLTADAWSSHSRAFLGVTCHWISQELQRESRTLACTKFHGSQTFDKIAEFLVQVMNRYQIDVNRVVSVVTDNGSNFCKAFREFGNEFDESKIDNLPDPEDALREVIPMEDDNENSSTSEETETDEDFTLFHTNIHEVMLEPTSEIVLPPHFRCISHTLSLIMTQDLTKVKGQKIYYKALAKCTKIWDLSSSPKSAVIIKDICKKGLLRPIHTRWNSLNKALGRLLEFKSNLPELCDKLGIPPFSEKEVDFLEEYMLITTPLANALDKMQGEKGMFMGSTLPALVQLERKFVSLKGKCKMARPFLEACITGLKSRFRDLLTINPDDPSDFLFAAISNPYFKLRWLEKNIQDKLKIAFVREARKFHSPSVSKAIPEMEAMEDDFFDFDLEPSAVNSTDHTDEVELECFRYLNDSSMELQMLREYPTVEKVFRRYNSALPSSAPVERLFSYGGLILSSRRCNLGDEKFEQLVMLKSNNIFKNRTATKP